jgi:serine/threonine protein kinase
MSSCKEIDRRLYLNLVSKSPVDELQGVVASFNRITLSPNVAAAVKCLAYPLEQNPTRLSDRTRQVALRLLSGLDDPFKKGCYGKFLGRGYQVVVQEVTVEGEIYAEKKLLGLDHPVFNRGFRYLSELDHPNIIKVLHATSMAFYMELAEKGSLNDPLPNMGRCWLQMTAGLAYLQEKGVVHRNIRYSNILITKDDQVKITGFSHAISMNAFKEKEDIALASHEYLPPEYRRQELKREDCLSIDVWSLAYCISLVFLKTMEDKSVLIPKIETPFKGFGVGEIEDKFDVKKVEQHDPTGIFQQVIGECFHSTPSSRPNVADLLARLEQVIK